jgi:hypothetical protein
MKRVIWFVGIVLLLIVTSAIGAAPASAAPAAQQANAWTGYYFNNMYLQGSPVFTRDDPYIISIGVPGVRAVVSPARTFPSAGCAGSTWIGPAIGLF